MDPLADYLDRHANRLTTLDPDADDDSDLEPLLDIVGDARVVALGESMHRIHEFYLVRHRIFRFLERRAGFTALVLESGFPEGLLLDRWVGEGGARSIRDLLGRGVTYHFGKCQEMLDQAAWMRGRALVGAPVHFYGMDVPDSASSALPGVLAALDVLDEADPNYAAWLRDHVLALFGYLPSDRSGLAQAATAIHAYLGLADATRFELTARIGDLVARMRALRVDYAARLGDVRRVDAGIRAAESARDVDAFLAAMTAGPTRTWPPANIRDAAIADTVGWILEREQRIVVAAANGHVQKVPYVAPPFVASPMATMGQHLADRFGDDLVVVGSAYGGGEAWLHRPGPDDPPGHSTPFVEDVGSNEPTSLDAALGASAIGGDFYVDLRQADGAAAAALDATAGTHNGPHIQPADARRAFDAVVYIDRISPWQTWIDGRGLSGSA